MHPNDTLNGKLVDSEWEREDEKHLRSSFGYWRVVEERMIRAQMKAEGKDPDAPFAIFEISRRVVENHKNDPTLREHQAAKGLTIAGVRVPLGIRFTDEELAFLVEHFAMANDPVAQSIRDKAVAYQKENP